jgi:hypothetical protein
MSVELASSRPLASAAEMKTLPAIDRPMARLSQTKRWRIKDGAWTMTSPISIFKLTAQERAALAVASLTNRPDKVTRQRWAKGVAAWRSEHHCPLVFGRVE